MSRMFKVNRRIDRTVQPWMDATDIFEEGETVFLYSGCTYGCIGSGVAVTRKDGETPFFEVPRDALSPVK